VVLVSNKVYKSNYGLSKVWNDTYFHIGLKGRFEGVSLTASRASVATLAFLASNSSVNTLKIFAPCGGKNTCQNACWGASPNPVVCGPVLTLRALTLGQNVPKQKCRETAQNCSTADQKKWKVFSNIRAGHIIVLPPQKTRLETLENRAFFRTKWSHISPAF